MTQGLAQILLTIILLIGSIIFVLIDQQSLAVALVGAVAGQGAAVGVSTAVNGNGGKR